MSQLTDKLSRYGVDIEETMARFVQDEELYLDCLNEFKDDASFKNLGIAIENGEFEQAFDCAHTLKGVAGNMGLTPLFETICGIVEPLRAHNYDNLELLYKNVMDERKRMIEALF